MAGLLGIGLALLLQSAVAASPSVPTPLPTPSPTPLPPPGSTPAIDQILAGAWAVLDRDSGRLILAYNADKPLYPASTTKIMTVLLTLEHAEPDDILTVSETAVKLPAGSSTVGLLAGEIVTVYDLAAGMMVGSGNDAANAAAEHVSGSLEAFVLLMNDKAAELGMTGSTFRNPSGLHDDAHVTTARDMAILADYAMRRPDFRRLAALTHYAMPATNLHPYPGWSLLLNTNRLLLFGDTVFVSPDLGLFTGVKTGSTPYAGNCLVASAVTRDGRELISVIFGVKTAADGRNYFNYSQALLGEAARLLAETGPLTPAPTPEPTLAPEPTETGRATQATPGMTASQPVDTADREPPLISIGGPWGVALLIILTGLVLACLVWLAVHRPANRRRSPARAKPNRRGDRR